MKFADAVTVSPYHIAYSDELKIRVGPFLHEDPNWKRDSRDDGLGLDDETLRAIRDFKHIDWGWKRYFDITWVRADWRPGLPKTDAVRQLARLG